MTTIVAVRDILQNQSSSNANLFKSLVENGKNSPYRCSQTTKQQFGPSVSDFPGLGKRLSPFDAAKLPSAEDLRSGCLQDARDAGILPEPSSLAQTADHPATGKEEYDLRPSQGLVDTSTAGTPAVLCFPCQYLENLCQEREDEQTTVLRKSLMNCNMLPGDTLVPLQHSNEGMTYATLLSGSVIWIMWPSTDHNIAVVQSVYEAFARGFDDAWIKGVSELGGGVFLKQTQGEGLRISPWCPMICLSTEASIIATYSVLDANDLVATLRKLPFLDMWFKTEIDGEIKQSKFNSAMIKYLELILQGEFDDLKAFKYPYVKEGPLQALLNTWDEVKDNVANVLDPANAELLQGIWLKFLQTTKGRPCGICGTNVYNKKKDMGKHFEDKHWPKMQAVDTKVLDKSTTEDASVSLKEQKRSRSKQVGEEPGLHKCNVS